MQTVDWSLYLHFKLFSPGNRSFITQLAQKSAKNVLLLLSTLQQFK